MDFVCGGLLWFPPLSLQIHCFPLCFMFIEVFFSVVCSSWLSGLSAFIGLIRKLVDLIDLSKSKTLPIYLSRGLFCLWDLQTSIEWTGVHQINRLKHTIWSSITSHLVVFWRTIFHNGMMVQNRHYPYNQGTMSNRA